LAEVKATLGNFGVLPHQLVQIAVAGVALPAFG
jgi:hypothetical protein